MSNFLSKLVDFAWGTPLLVLLMGGGLLLVFRSRFIPIIGLKHAILLISGKFHFANESKRAKCGQLTHFQALTNALSSTVGMGNISGVAVAISQGGPGALFWMWLSAFIGMNTKFFECTLAVMFRGKDHLGEVQGGPMYVIKNALPKKFYFLAVAFAAFGLIGTLPLYNANQLADFTFTYYQIPKEVIGVICMVLAMYVLSRGVRGIAEVTSKIVPLMCLFYVAIGLIIIGINIEQVPSVFKTIFEQAFSSDAIWGGAVGVGIKEVMRIGIKRAAFSNEAGVGTAAMAHSNADTDEPIAEGLVAMIGPLLDTLIVCTITGLIILTSLSPDEIRQYNGVIMTAKAFEVSLGEFGKHFLAFAILLFSVSTIIGMSNYTQKCWHFLFRGKRFFTNKTFILMYGISLFIGSITAPKDLINLLDSAFAFMAYPSMFATIMLSGVVIKELKLYRAKYLTPEQGK